MLAGRRSAGQKGDRGACQPRALGALLARWNVGPPAVAGARSRSLRLRASAQPPGTRSDRLSGASTLDNPRFDRVPVPLGYPVGPGTTGSWRQRVALYPRFDRIRAPDRTPLPPVQPGPGGSACVPTPSSTGSRRLVRIPFLPITLGLDASSSRVRPGRRGFLRGAVPGSTRFDGVLVPCWTFPWAPAPPSVHPNQKREGGFWCRGWGAASKTRRGAGAYFPSLFAAAARSRARCSPMRASCPRVVGS